MTGRLVLCGTPIGNLADLSPRAVETLAKADVVACEDTRRTRKLLTHAGVKAPKLVVFNDATEKRRTRELLEMVKKGATVVVVSDAGMPGLSDPGYRLVHASAEAGVEVEVVPGPSAVIAALAVSGLPPGRFSFEGFMPRKPGDRKRRLTEIVADTRTLVFFVTPHRLKEQIADVAEVLGDRPASLARELTKLHEEVLRGSLSRLGAEAESRELKGEMVLVVSGAIHEHRVAPDAETLADEAEELMDSGMDRKAALSQVAKREGVARREVFDALVARRKT